MPYTCEYCQIVIDGGTSDADKCGTWLGFKCCCNCCKDQNHCTQQGYDQLGCNQCKQSRQHRQTGAPDNVPAAATGAEPSTAANNHAAHLVEDATAHAARIVADA